MAKTLPKRPGKKLKFGFITDPLDNYNREAETSLFLMRETARRGHALFVWEPKDLFLKQNEVWGGGKKIELTGHPQNFYRIVAEKPYRLTELDVLFLRKDPPFDQEYLYHLWLLSFLEEKVRMINSPSALLKHNEKLCILHFPFIPATWVGRRTEELQAWAKNFSDGIVIKPLNEAGGRDVRWIKNPDDIHLTYTVMAQEYLPAITRGDKRVMLWQGKNLGAFVRRPTRPGEFRANLHLGGKFEQTELTPKEKEITAAVARWSQRERLAFVGFDMIGEKLTEINVTSPMGIREINQLYQMHIETTMIDTLCQNA